jgi:O-antigen/teichoic acid export membrane protein
VSDVEESLPWRGAAMNWFRGLSWRLMPATLFDWAIVLAGLLMAQGLGSVVTIVIARRVAPIDFGQYLASMSLAGLLVVFPTLGLDNWLLAQGDAVGRIAELWHSALRSRLALLALWLLALSGIGLALPSATYPLAVLIPTGIMLAAQSVANLAYSALRLIGQHRRITVLQSIFAVASLVIALLMPFVANPIVFFAMGTAAVAVGTAIAVVILLGRQLRRPASLLSTRSLFGAARPFMVGDIAVMVYSRTTLALISLIIGAAGAAAFGPADSLITASFWVPTALYVLVMPMLSRAHAAGRPGFVRLSLAQLLLQALTGLAMSTAIFVLTPLIIRTVFGAAYDSAIPILQWTSPIPFFKSLNFGLGAWLTSGHRQVDRTWVQIAVAGFTVAAGLLAIPHWGLAGAAAVEVANETLLTIGYALYVINRWSRARPEA